MVILGSWYLELLNTDFNLDHHDSGVRSILPVSIYLSPYPRTRMSTFDGVALGVDSCPLGWLATVIDSGKLRTETYENFEKLRETYTDADRILVDIPIGFPDGERRRCDEEARDLLGCRGVSVFYPPCRSAALLDEYQEANNEHENQIGHGLSQQAHSISEKILEVTDAVGRDYEGVVREAHPELCFAALNGQPIAYSKSTDRGRGLRIQVLGEKLDDARAHYQDVREDYLINEVRRDDILDSMVLAVAAGDHGLTTVPSDPSATEPRIHYPEFEVPVLEK